MTSKSISLTTVVMTALAACGCSLWYPADMEISELPAPRMSSDSVVWEIDVVYLEPGDEQLHSQIWNEADEQHLPADLTRRLKANGIRCGLVGMQLPTVLRDRLDQQRAARNPGSDAKQLFDLVTAMQHRRLQARAGQRYEIVSRPVRDELVVLYRDNEQLSGARYRQAQCLLAVKSHPLGDGRVRLELTPEVHYGPARQRITGQAGVFRVQAKRDSKVFDRLRMEPTLSPGQTLLLTRTADVKALGGDFFTDSVNGQDRQKVVLIRLAQTQYDDLFATERIDPAPSIASDF